MNKRKLRSRILGVAAVGAASLAAVLMVGTTIAAAAPGDPASKTAPHFYNGVVSGIRDSGSDTTFFMMQKIGDLYTSAGLYGCTLNSAASQTLFNSDFTATAGNEESYCQSGQNVDTTDVNDNWDRTEVTEGVDDVGSGAGQGQLCGSANTPTPLPVDFSRSSKPVTTTCTDGDALVGTGYAKDGVPAVDFPTVNPSALGTSTFSDGTSHVNYSAINGGNVGPVSAGWLPGDPTSGPFDGTSFTNLSNADNGGGASSTAYRLWCATDSTRITDWGSLTNLGPKLEFVDVSLSGSSATINGGAPEGADFAASVANGDAITGTGIPASTTVSGGGGTGTLTLSHSVTSESDVTVIVNVGTGVAEGNGIAVGIPVRLLGVNTASGTEATWLSYTQSGTSGSGTEGCSANINTNAAADPNSGTGSTTSAHVALENNAAQVAQFAEGDFPNDNVDQAIELATSIYFESNGVYNTDPFAGETQIQNGTIYTAVKVNLNGLSPTTPRLLNNTYATARTLWNVYNTTTLRASVAGFLNWICDSNTDFNKGEDNTSGLNYDDEVTTIIEGEYGFIRLTDTSQTASQTTPPDNLAHSGDNTTCASGTTGSPAVGNGLPPITTSGASPATGSVPTANLDS